MPRPLYILYVSSLGYSMFERVEGDEVSMKASKVQKAMGNLAKFSKICKFKGFQPFKTQVESLACINAVTEGGVTDELRSFVELMAGGKSIKLGVEEKGLGNTLQDALDNVKCVSDDLVLEFIRGIRTHFVHYIKTIDVAEVAQGQLGLSHAYSRAKVKFNVNKADTMITQAIAMTDQLDKDLNTFAMRTREWYGYHFPELVRVVPDNETYCRVVCAVRNKSSLSEDDLERLAAIEGMDEDTAQEVLEAARMSMGTDISEIDLISVDNFAQRVVSLSDFKRNLNGYLTNKMEACAPNLTALMGEHVGARLISHAGSLTSLAKFPASTVQILGAEKALFRALKTKGNTPKYGLIFNSTFIGRAAPKNKGRISRYLANKASIASRIDAFSDDAPTDKYGVALRAQVEERLDFYKSGKTPTKNADAMQAVVDDVMGDSRNGGGDDDDDDDVEMKTPSKKSKRSRDDGDSDDDETTKSGKKRKKEKKSEKKKKKKDKKSK